MTENGTADGPPPAPADPTVSRTVLLATIGELHVRLDDAHTALQALAAERDALRELNASLIEERDAGAPSNPARTPTT